MAARFVEAWAGLGISNDDFIRTTEPRHHRAVQRFLQTDPRQRLHRARRLPRAVLRGVRGLQEGVRARRRQMRRSTCTPVEMLEEENYFFKLSAFERPPARVVRGQPRRRRARRPSATRRSGSSRVASRTSRSPGPPPAGASRSRGTRATSSTSGTTRWSTTSPPSATARTTPASRRGGRPCTTSSGKDILRFHCVWWPAMCMAAGIDPPAHLLVHGWLLVVGGEDVEVEGATRSPAARAHRRTSASTPSGTTCCATPRSGPTATSPTRASPPATTPIWPTTSGT